MAIEFRSLLLSVVVSCSSVLGNRIFEILNSLLIGGKIVKASYKNLQTVFSNCKSEPETCLIKY